MEFMQRMWNPFGVPVPGFAPPGAPGAGSRRRCRFRIPRRCSRRSIPPRSTSKIAELRVIENWLAMSLNLMQMSIKTMELQKASLEAMRAATAPAKPAKKKSGT